MLNSWSSCVNRRRWGKYCVREKSKCFGIYLPNAGKNHQLSSNNFWLHQLTTQHGIPCLDHIHSTCGACHSVIFHGKHRVCKRTFSHLFVVHRVKLSFWRNSRSSSECCVIWLPVVVVPTKKLLNTKFMSIYRNHFELNANLWSETLSKHSNWSWS